MALLGAWNTAGGILVVSGFSGGRRCPAGPCNREREDFERVAAMGTLPTESIFWSQAEDTKVFDDGVDLGEGG